MVSENKDNKVVDILIDLEIIVDIGRRLIKWKLSTSTSSIIAIGFIIFHVIIQIYTENILQSPSMSHSG